MNASARGCGATGATCLRTAASRYFSAPGTPRRSSIASRGRTSTAEFDSLLDQVAAFERTLTDDGAVIVKFWMHLSKKAQKKRLKEFEKDPLQRWRVTKEQWKHWEMFDKFVSAADRAIRRTSTEAAQWHIVEGEDERYRTVAVATQLRDAIRRSIERRADRQVSAAAGCRAQDGGGRSGESHQTRRTRVQRSRQPRSDRRRSATTTSTRSSAEKQARLNLLQRRAVKRGVSTILVFEGWDAAGKGGAIRRVTASLDARDYQVIPIAAPTDEERAHHYLWRFWRHLSRKGRLTIFDRSWYGRVLVERVEGFATEAEYMRAYGEINHFEEQLVNHGILVAEVLDSHQQGRAAQTIQRSRAEPATSAGRSPTKTGATASDGRTTPSPSTTWWSARARRSRRGRSSKATTRTSRGSRCSGRSRPLSTIA